MRLHSSAAKLLLPAFYNLAANKKTEKKAQTDRLTDSKDLQIHRPLTSKQSKPGMGDMTRLPMESQTTAGAPRPLARVSRQAP